MVASRPAASLCKATSNNLRGSAFITDKHIKASLSEVMTGMHVATSVF